jgi:hypothetical protein
MIETLQSGIRQFEMKWSKSLSMFGWCSVLFFGLATSSVAQVTTGEIVGTVTEKTGAAVSGAKVTVTDIDTQAVRTLTTGSEGNFVFPLLQPGPYKVEVSSPSFEKYVATGVALSAGGRVRVDPSLTVGEITQAVEVNASDNSGMQTDSSTVQSEVSERAVQDLPLNGRNFINLVQLAPGVNAGNPVGIPAGGAPDDRRQSSEVVANGQSYLENNQLIDGLDNNEREQGVIGVRPSIDAISEIRVITSNYPAEVGRAAGAVVNVITKSGTNSFHGSAFEFVRNDMFDTRDYFARTGRKPELRLNQFGGSLGGPIIKNKVFFFGAYEQLREIQGITYTVTVPTLFEEQNPGNFTDIGGPVVPTVNPVSLNYFKLYPAPNQTPQSVSGQTPVGNYGFSPNKTFYGTTIDGRIDWQINANNNFFVHYGYNPVSVNTPGKLPPAQAFGTTVASGGVSSFGDVFANINGTSNITAQGASMGYTHIFNSHLVLELKTGFTRVNIQTVPLDYGQNLSTKFGVNGSNLGTPDTSGLAAILFFAGPYASLGDGFFVPILNRNNNFQYNATATYSKGAHSVKFGAALIRRQLNYFQDQFSPQGGFIFSESIPPYFNTMANFLAGKPIFDERGNLLFSPGYRMWEPSAFAQDDWRVSKMLTLNLGVRYDIFTPFTEAHNNYSNFNASTLSVQIAGVNTSSTLGIKTHYKDVSPRIGFALSLPKSTVVRGGFGVGFFPVDFQNTIQNANPPYSYVCFPCFTGLAYPTLPSPAAPSVTNPSGTVTSKSPNFGPGYNEQFNLTIQKQLGANVLTATYVGEVGRRLLYQGDLDRPLPPGPGKPQPSYVYQTQLPEVTSIAYNYNGAVMSYNALLLSFNRQLKHGLTFATNYTLAHGLIDGSPTGTSADPVGLVSGNPGYDYGNSNLDIRHRFAATANYQLPLGRSSKGFEAIAIKDWQVNLLTYWQTGLPFTVEDSTPQINLPGVTSDRPNRIAPAALAHPTINKWFNTSAFASQTLGTPGNAERNGFYGPHDQRVDVSLLKTFPIDRAVKLQFRAECFNIVNHPNFGTPNAGGSVPSGAPAGTILTGPGYGTISSTVAGEVPRQFQFALKLQF